MEHETDFVDREHFQLTLQMAKLKTRKELYSLSISPTISFSLFTFGSSSLSLLRLINFEQEKKVRSSSFIR